MAQDFTYVAYPQPHIERGRQIVAAHPQVRTLAGPLPATALWITALAASQLALSIALRHSAWYVWLPIAYVVGATIDHALWVLIHDCCHHLVFKWRPGNRIMALVANLPLVFPSAMSFWKYHLVHHGHLNDVEFDPDVPGPVETRVIGASSLRKTLWLAAFPLVVGAIRPRRLVTVPFMDRWTAINFVTQAAVVTLLVAGAGWAPLMYLLASTVMAIGLHPLGARWIQEHYVFAPGQETYSYYGPLNLVAFNIGYHNEHHDIATIPWSRLPRLRAMAPEFYDSLYAHRSWTALLIAFMRDADITLFNRIVRRSGRAAPSVPADLAS